MLHDKAPRTTQRNEIEKSKNKAEEEEEANQQHEQGKLEDQEEPLSPTSSIRDDGSESSHGSKDFRLRSSVSRSFRQGELELLQAMDVKEAGTLFKNFCRQQRNIESFMFLKGAFYLSDRIEFYFEDENRPDMLARLQMLYENFLLAGAPYEVNIPGSMRKKAVAFYKEEIEGEEDPQHIDIDTILDHIHPVVEEVKRLVLTDLWPRFVRSDEYEEFKRICQGSESESGSSDGGDRRNAFSGSRLTSFFKRSDS